MYLIIKSDIDKGKTNIEYSLGHFLRLKTVGSNYLNQLFFVDIYAILKNNL